MESFLERVGQGDLTPFLHFLSFLSSFQLNALEGWLKKIMKGFLERIDQADENAPGYRRGDEQTWQLEKARDSLVKINSLIEQTVQDL